MCDYKCKEDVIGGLSVEKLYSKLMFVKNRLDAACQQIQALQERVHELEEEVEPGTQPSPKQEDFMPHHRKRAIKNMFIAFYSEDRVDIIKSLLDIICKEE